MRLRNIPGAGEVIDNSPYCIKEPVELKGKWHDFLGNNNPIHIEVGMGKGRFLMDLARLHPEINYIGIERYTSVLLRAVQKMQEDELPNVHFLCIDAATLPDIFDRNEVDRIYTNFPIHGRRTGTQEGASPQANFLPDMICFSRRTHRVQD